MRYSFACPANDGYVVTVEAANDDEAVAKILEESKDHAVKHPEMVMSQEQVVGMVKSGLKKG